MPDWINQVDQSDSFPYGDEPDENRPPSGAMSPFADQYENSSSETLQQTPDLRRAHFSPGPELETIDTKDSELERQQTAMKRNRWGTQYNKKGRTPQRQKSLFNRRFSSFLHPQGGGGSDDGRDRDTTPPRDDRSSADDSGFLDPDEVLPGERQIYFNMQLPPELKDPLTNLPVQKFVRNKIRTTKYTPLSFFPKNIYFQFHNVANIYFLAIDILGAFSIFGVQNPGLAAVPIVVIVIITAIKDAIEDYRRTVLDLEVNNTATEVLVNNENPNVVDENISLWRRFKKANTRGMMRMGQWCYARKAARKEKKTGVKSDTKSPFHNTLDRAEVRSEYSAETRESIDLEDLDNPFSSQDNELEDPAESVIQPRINPIQKAYFQRDYWKNVRVGDFIRIRSDEEIPADVVILSTSEDDGACYVETKNLDGETNLKIRQALHCGRKVVHSQDCQKASFWMETEAPQPSLYTFSGVAKWKPDDITERSEPITINNLLLRGCTLRNTKWVVGVVCYTGFETKIMLNAGVTPTKRSRLQRGLNLYVIYNFALLFILCFVSGLVNGIIHTKKQSSSNYFEFGIIGGSAPVAGIVSFFAALILYQSLVPISLYISIEIVKTCQAFYIYSDCYMYYEPIDYPCTPKSWNISDDLGQIEYVFSDKTGTLTQNVMEFRKCTINGVAYGKAYTEALMGMRKRQGVDVEKEAKQMEIEIADDRARMIKTLRGIYDSPHLIDSEVTFVSSQFVDDLQGAAGPQQARANFNFMLWLTLCNSVITENSKVYEGRKDFKAQSPDEAALVSAARDCGFALVGRVRHGVVVNIQGQDVEYQILNILEFNSTRKRMSAIVKIKSDEGDRIVLICKGADSVIYERLRPGVQQELREKTAVQLEEFANEGLRTMCMADCEIDPKEYYAWNERYEEAAASIVNREDKLDAVADTIERNLMLVGGTAIEDRLQDGVPTTISLLADGGIKLWVLTGDKVETAINIGFSCNLLDNSMELLVIRVENGDKGSVPALIDDYLHRHFNMEGSWEELEEAKRDHSSPSGRFAVVIDGEALKLALNPAINHKFLLLCKQCKSVLCCRVSPAQKAGVVNLVRSTLDVMTLSIGDGANDVAMIQEADVGVGIAGEEGRQAVMSSDYAIGQFRFLSRLLLVHGRWDYKRLAEMIPNFFYKNVIFTFTMFWYGIFTNFDATYLYDYTFVMFFNLAFTSLPVICMGILDQDVPDKISLAVPQLYRRGIHRADFTETKFWFYMITGVFMSFVSFFFPYFCYMGGGFQSMTGRPVDHRFWIGMSSCTISVMVCNFFVLTNQYRWDIVSTIVNIVSTLLVFVWAGIYSSFVGSAELYKAAAETYDTLVFWAVTLLGIVACMIPHFAWLTGRILWNPKDVDIIREQWRLGEFDEVLATPLASDDPTDSAQYNNPYRPSTWRPRTRREKRAARRSMRQPYEIRNESHTDITRSPDFVRFGNRKVGAEEFLFDVPASPTSPTLRDHVRSNASPSLRKSLEIARHSSRWEQPPVHEGIENIRTSMELDDLTTAEDLVGRHMGQRERN